ncbi:hypothetical protein KIH74_04570 [Kineosporia sp. J2-2]|uniref:Phospholipase A2 n=1 Tax=Kineosporia corallincola TaxID=2835133 RepID=A0ABS5TAT7_9ACTN|nr:phospholipase A2 [Kineosporia corallincola]MBT0768183.1 hypothetical protein [Kineosporia corallincola]
MKAPRKLWSAGPAAALIIFVAALAAPTQAAAATTDVAGSTSVTTVSSAPTADLPPAAVTEPGTYSYAFAAQVPEGGRLRPLTGDAGSSFSSEVLVEDAAGEVVGAYDAPYTVTHDGRQLPTTYRIDGTRLIQTVTLDDTAQVPAYVLFSDYTATGTDSSADSSTGQARTLAVTQVTVPSNYVYDPSLGSLHDYCTSSPDSFGSADFRGPCARHDLCYEAPGDHKTTCDAALKTDLVTNCQYAYSSVNPLRSTCEGVAAVYYAAVSAFGDDT